MGQSRWDKEWPRPRHTRHVWVIDEQTPLRMPHQGLVLEWRRHSYRWAALVAYVVLSKEQQPQRVVTEWVPTTRLRGGEESPRPVAEVLRRAELPITSDDVDDVDELDGTIAD